MRRNSLSTSTLSGSKPKVLVVVFIWLGPATKVRLRSDSVRRTGTARLGGALPLGLFALELFVPPDSVCQAVRAPAMFRRAILEATARLGCGRGFGGRVFGLEQEVVILWNVLARQSINQRRLDDLPSFRRVLRNGKISDRKKE